MAKKYSTEEFWELYKKLPKDLQDFLAQEEIGNNLKKICSRYEIENKYDKMMDLVTEVLIGLLPPIEFKKEVEKEPGIKKEIGEKICREIARFIFFPVKESISSLYNIEAPSTSKKESSEENEQAPTKDTYRESIE